MEFGKSEGICVVGGKFELCWQLLMCFLPNFSFYNQCLRGPGSELRVFY